MKNWPAIVVLVLLAGLVVGREQAPPPAVERRVVSQPVAAPVETLDLKKLNRERRSNPVQDPFALPTPPAPPPAPTPAPVAAVKPEPPPPPKAPPLPFTYAGRMIRGDQTFVYLVRNQELIVGEAGLQIGNDYRLVGISESAVHFVYLPLDEQQLLAFPQ